MDLMNRREALTGLVAGTLACFAIPTIQVSQQPTNSVWTCLGFHVNWPQTRQILLLQYEGSPATYMVEEYILVPKPFVSRRFNFGQLGPARVHYDSLVAELGRRDEKA